MTPKQMKRVAEIAEQWSDEHFAAYPSTFRQAISAALADPLLRQENEYICKCGLRVEPHRCKTGEEF
jgi:hypothetical protein